LNGIRFAWAYHISSNRSDCSAARNQFAETFTAPSGSRTVRRSSHWTCSTVPRQAPTLASPVSHPRRRLMLARRVAGSSWKLAAASVDRILTASYLGAIKSA
jgi:hypothetical protein